MTNLAFVPAHQLARLIRDRAISAVEPDAGWILFNLTGHPVVVIPIGQTQNGMPIGLQIVGHRCREMELLAIAQQLDEIIGDLRYPPAYYESPQDSKKITSVPH
jgi:Asp-tRNA(Asn)/Glu-tRNA(Gln) amidotransferase A subunit family amidase